MKRLFDLLSKLYTRWHRPGTVMQVKPQHTFIMQTRYRRYNDRIDTVIVDNYAVIYDSEFEFGYINTIKVTDFIELPSKIIDQKILSHSSEEMKAQLFNIMDEYLQYSKTPQILLQVSNKKFKCHWVSL